MAAVGLRLEKQKQLSKQEMEFLLFFNLYCFFCYCCCYCLCLCYNFHFGFINKLNENRRKPQERERERERVKKVLLQVILKVTVLWLKYSHAYTSKLRDQLELSSYIHLSSIQIRNKFNFVQSLFPNDSTHFPTITIVL